jgi:hypothetical protein
MTVGLTVTGTTTSIELPAGMLPSAARVPGAEAALTAAMNAASVVSPLAGNNTGVVRVTPLTLVT